MHNKKKSDRAFYALATSSISDIPEIANNKLSQNQYYYENLDYKYASSPFNDSLLERSHQDSINLNFSTSKPFFQELSPYQNKTQHRYNNSQLQSSNSTVNRKKTNNKLIQYSYSNFVILFNHINKINKRIKFNAFQHVRQFQRTQNKLRVNDKNSKQSQTSRTTNQTYNENILYSKKAVKKKIQQKQQFLEGANLVKRWLEYHILIIYRRGFNYISQYGDQRCYESSSGFGYSVKKDHLLTSKFNLTQNNSQQRNQIEESLVYTVQNNSESIRKQATSSVFDSNPTFKKIPNFQKKKQHIQPMAQLGNTHSFVFKDKEMLKYYTKEPKLKSTQPLTFPKIIKNRQRNYNGSEQIIKHINFNQQENILSQYQHNPLTVDIFTPNKCDIYNEKELEIINQIISEGSNIKSESEYDNLQAQHLTSSKSSQVEPNQHFVRITKEKNSRNGSQLRQNSYQNDYQPHASSNANERQTHAMNRSNISNNYYVQQNQNMQTRKIIKDYAAHVVNFNAPIATFNNQFVENRKQINFLKPQQYLSVHEPMNQNLGMSGSKKMVELQNDRMRVNHTQMTNNVYVEKPIYYANKNVPEYSSIILTQAQRQFPSSNLYTSHRVTSSKMPTQKIIVHPPIIEPGTIVSSKRLNSKDSVSSQRQNFNIKSQSNILQNVNRQPCIYYQQPHRKVQNVQLINSHDVRRNNAKVMEHRSLSPKINIRPQTRINRQEGMKHPIVQSNHQKIINFPEKNNKKQFASIPNDYMMHNLQVTERPVVHQNFPKPLNTHLKMKNTLRVRSPNDKKPIFSNQYELIEKQKKLNFIQPQMYQPHNVNINFHASSNSNSNQKIYSLSSDQKLYQRPTLSVQNHLRRPQNFITLQSHNESENYSNYTQQLSSRNDLKRPKSNNKKLQVTLKVK